MIKKMTYKTILFIVNKIVNNNIIFIHDSTMENIQEKIFFN